MKFNDISNQRFGKLLVLNFAYKLKKKSTKYFWQCKCDCGNETAVDRGHLKSGAIQSCGCLGRRRGKDSPHFKGYEEITGVYYNSLKKGASDRGRNFAFSVSIEYLWNLFLKQNKKCALTNWKVTFNKQQTASLDRIDSTKGYVEGNVQWVHKDVNLMKNNYPQEHFIDVCTCVAKNFNRDIIKKG